MRFDNPIPLFFSLALACASSVAMALPSDREQPIRVQADSKNGAQGAKIRSRLAEPAMTPLIVTQGDQPIAFVTALRALLAGWRAAPGAR